MKIILSVLLSLCLTTLLAQRYVPSTASMIEENMHWRTDKKAITSNHIYKKSIFRFNDSKDVKGALYKTFQYDSSGALIEMIAFRKNGKQKNRFVMAYNDLGYTNSFTIYGSNNRFLFKTCYVYDENGNAVDEKSYWKSETRNTIHRVTTYNAEKKPTELKEYDLKGKLFQRYEYTYHPDGSKRQVICYNSKGKEKYTWNYECDPGGQLKKKYDRSVCLKYETDAQGNTIRIKEQIVKQGRVVRIVEKYDINNNILEAIGYDRKGHVQFRNTTTYDGTGNPVQFVVYKTGGSKIRSMNTYEYNDSGLPSAQHTFRKFEKEDHLVRFVYEGMK